MISTTVSTELSIRVSVWVHNTHGSERTGNFHRSSYQLLQTLFSLIVLTFLLGVRLYHRSSWWTFHRLWTGHKTVTSVTRKSSKHDVCTCTHIGPIIYSSWGTPMWGGVLSLVRNRSSFKRPDLWPGSVSFIKSFQRTPIITRFIKRFISTTFIVYNPSV